RRPARRQRAFRARTRSSAATCSTTRVLERSSARRRHRAIPGRRRRTHRRRHRTSTMTTPLFDIARTLVGFDTVSARSNAAAAEVASSGARRLVPVLSDLAAPTPLPRLAWIGEPTSYRIFHTHKGIVLFDVTVRGAGGHSSVPDQGVNAIAVMARVIAAITDVQAELRTADVPAVAAEFPECPYVTLNVATVHGGSAVNMIPDRCVLAVSYRPLPDSDPRAPYETIRARLASCDRSDPGSPGRAATIEVGAAFVLPAMLSPRGPPPEHALATVLG